MGKIEMISAIITIVLAVGGGLYAAVSIKKDVEVLTNKNNDTRKQITSLDKKIDVISKDYREYSKIKFDTNNNKVNLLKIDNKLEDINKLLIKSMLETRDILMKEVSKK